MKNERRLSVWTTSADPKTPQAFITKGKQRIKQHGRNVYLSDNDEYQIELFNPMPMFIMAKIKIDGDYISDAGVVVRPGERIFLERYLDSNNKFVYKTYTINGNSTEVLSAVRNNGYVEIEFYAEDKKQIPTSNNPLIFTSNNTFNGYYGWPNGGSTFTNVNYNYSTPTFGNSSGVTNFSLTSGIGLTNTSTTSANTQTLRKMETGTTEKGEASTQTFTNSGRNFSTAYFAYVGWQILPTSTKPITSEDVNTLYCGNCGAKRKKDTHKFCPHCGTKF